ncbi:MAG: type I DNA topoisomerase [Desulfovibrionaceae bacterium]
MPNDLIIVESPAKVKTIGRFLGKQYAVEASVGHVRDLPQRDLGVDEEHGFEPHYEIIDGKQDVVKRLRAAAKKADHVFLAPDPDREGEAIAWHVAELIKDQNTNVSRISFNEITKRAVLEALEHPRALDRRLFDSQQARRVLDRLVGYKISPILWKSVKRGISAGRVQSVALRLIVEREKERRAFQTQEYWLFKARLEGPEPPAFPAELWKIGGKALKPGKFVVGNAAEAEALKARLAQSPFSVAEVVAKERKRAAQPPFITSTLQQEASNRLGFSAKRTMSTAQRLYEGVDLGGRGVTALITYMRTDSVRVAKEAQDAARELIEASWGKEFKPAKPNAYKSKGSAQDAHEAIRPVDVNVTPADVQALLPPDQFKLYNLIWSRFMASQMAPAKFYDTVVDIAAADTLWRAKGERLLFPGWLAAWGRGEDEKDAELPKLAAGDPLTVHALDAEQKFTQPPPRYSEATLVKELEDKGIGRPSTYAQIISTIQDRDYVTLEERRFAPTELGMLVSDQLSENFTELMDIGFTAAMESDLDAVAEGQRDWGDLIQQFADGFYRRLGEAETHMKKTALETNIPCPECGKPMVIRFGKAGEFLGCSGFPDCRTLKNFRRGPQGEIEIIEDTPPEALNITCEKCGKPMVIKNSRRGEFLGCSGYPACRNVKNFTRDADGTIHVTEAEALTVVGPCPDCGRDMVIKRSRQGSRFVACTGYPECTHTEPLRTGVKCPREGCDGELVEKASRRGKVFYSCSRYPACDYALWNEPVPGPCPACGHPILVRKVQRGGKTVIMCPVKDCGHIVDQD